MLFNLINPTLILLLLTLTSASSQAMDPETIELLVVGSTRSDHMPESTLHGKASFSYEDKIQAEATTIDLRPSDHPRHIQADATNYLFQQRLNNIYIERMYTSFGDAKTPGEHNNLIGAIIKNILPRLNINGSLIIELDPCLRFMPGFPTKSELAAYRKANPFHAWQSYSVFLCALLSLSEPRMSPQDLQDLLHLKGYSETMIEDICDFQECLYRWVQRIAPEMGMGSREFLGKLQREMTIYDDIERLTEENAPLIGVVRLLPQGANLSAKEFERSFLSRDYQIIPRQELDFYVRDSKAIEEDYYGALSTFWFYDAKTFFNATDSNKMIGFIAVEINKNYIIEYLVNLGFKDVSIEFKDSPFNNRKNFWIVSARKS